MKLSEEQKRIYNTHLATSRRMREKPYRSRKDFEKLDDDKTISLEKLDKMFNSYSNINIQMFFEAPYFLYQDVEYFDLDYFTTQKAKKDYTQYIKQIQTMSPDSEESLKRLIQGLKYISNFCKQHDLTLEEYVAYSEKNIPSMLEHLKNHKINFYVLHALGVSKFNIENRILEFMFSDFWKTFQKTKNMYYGSSKMKVLAKKAINKIKNGSD
jgi:hypothetical protein